LAKDRYAEQQEAKCPPRRYLTARIARPGDTLGRVVSTAVCARGAGEITIAGLPRSRPPGAPSLDSPPRGAPRRSRARDCWPRACAPRSTPTAAWPPRPASPHRTLAARPAARRVHLLSSERWVSARAVIIREVAGQDVAQVAFAEDEDMIQTLPPGRTDAPGATLGSRGPSRTWATASREVRSPQC